MTPGLSLYLDLVRLLAALAVFCFHLGYGRLIGPPFDAFRDFGTPGVMVFFVLSGFVIAHVVTTRERDARAYAIARLSRLYSVALPALLLVFVLDGIGARLDPTLYPLRAGFDSFVACLFFVNAASFASFVHGSMSPYWSLCNEAWYYVIAGLFVFCRGPGRAVWPVLAALFAGLRVMMLFPVWLLGAGLYLLAARLWPRPWTGLALFALPVAGFFAASLQGLLAPIRGGIAVDPAHVGLGLLVAALFAVHLLGAALLAPWLHRLLRPVAGAIRWLAGASFTLYLLHLPLAYALVALSPWPVGTLPSAALVLGGTLVGTLLVAELTERRKTWWRGVFQALIPAAPLHLPAGATTTPRR